MRLSYLANAIGLILIYISLVILSPVIIALIYRDWMSVAPFLSTSLISLTAGYFLRKGSAVNLNDIKKSEGLFIVAASWVVFSLIAAIPYLHYGISPLNAVFEAVSGITTTGATILTSFDYPKAFFFWRALTQWIGGLGIIVLFTAILPQFAVAGRQMFFAEAPGPTEDKITPRIKNTASALWKIYFALTVFEIILLALAGMPAFDAVCNSLSTLSAGGFSTNPQSIMGYNSGVINWIMIVFMFLGGTSFILQYQVITRKNPTLVFKSEEFRSYLGFVVLMSIIIAAALVLHNGYSLSSGITAAFYQVVSIITSTGSASVDYAQWHFTAKILLFAVMFSGACSMSTGGGIKLTRWLIVFKTMRNELKRILHPNAVLNIKVDDKTISQDVIGQTIMFVCFYFFIAAVSAVLIGLIEHNAAVALTGSVSAIGNIGPALGEHIGPMGTFFHLQPLTKIIMVINMLVGRLELIPFLVLFQKDFWHIS
ncbi:MAG: TrkH family potassium uptake protein [Heliobacteriaceae bacterium]|jgi:trk system potassium uptake protein TrkH|nr:TrkH family potassium uptake protein [Heliobacteriaceae bacterium]